MSIPGAANPLLLASTSTAYTVSRSVRLNSADSAYFSRTPASAGNRKTWTWAGWVKRSAAWGALFRADPGSSDFTYLTSDSDKLVINQFTGGSAVWGADTVAVFRDYSAWYHIVLAVDTTQATASDRLKLYINNTLQSLTTRGGYPSTYPAQNNDTHVNRTIDHRIGNTSNCYLADIHFIDGQALTPSSFTEVSATTGQLIPKKYTGTFTGNSFWLQFADNSSNTATTLGKDSSGLGNNWTPVNVSTGISVPSPVSSSTGALPIYNTTGTYGETKGTGTRTDSNSSSIVLAVAMDGTNGGTTFSDLSATIKGSGSAKTITNSNVTTATAQSKYYGSSGLFDSSTDELTVPAGADFAYGTGDFTWECWVYPTSYPNTYIQVLWSQDASGVNYLANGLLGSFFGTPGKFVGLGLQSTYVVPLNRWTHLAAVRSSGVVSLYVNGVSVATGSNTTNYSDTSRNPAIGGYPWDTASNFYGYMQDVRVYKGVAKYSANFIPPASTGDPYINAACDSLVDTPTSYGTDDSLGGSVRGNYATWNPTLHSLNGNKPNLSNGNLDQSGNISSIGSFGLATIVPGSGKWYMEATMANANFGPGIWKTPLSPSSYAYQQTNFRYFGDGNVYNQAGTVVASYSTFTTGDVIGVALDLDNGRVFFSKNGTWQGSSNPATGANPAGSTGIDATWTFGLQSTDAATGTCNANFGQRPFAYTAPSGFKALVDTNLPTPVVAKPSTVFDALLYTGNGAARSITGLGFNPDLVWLKSRSAATDHELTDSVRGVTKSLSSNLTAAEATDTGGLTAFNSDGFSLGTDTKYNNNAATYVGWCWDAGSSTVSNTQGSITSSVRANTSAGFSIVTFTGPVSPSTVGHGLGVAPSLIILKNRDQGGAGYRWCVYHQSIGNTKALFLDGTNAESTNSTYWNNTTPTSTVFSVGGAIITGAEKMVAYCFSPVSGYSSFGSYTGNGSTDGPFVYTGHRSRWILLKRTDAVSDWWIYDTARDTYNLMGTILYPNLSAAEFADTTVFGRDLLSNGFKVRTSNATVNGNGATYIYASFAEFPFQYARAR